MAPAKHLNYPVILTAAPDFVDLAGQELAEAAPQATHEAVLAPGVWLVDILEPFEELASHWQAQPPIFVRHICPVQAIVRLQGQQEADLEALAAVVRKDLASLIDAGAQFSVQTRILSPLPYKPFDLNTALAELVRQEIGVSVNVRAPQQVLSVVCAFASEEAAGKEPMAYLGVSATEENLSDWAGGVHRFGREEGQISRSEFKLLEALAVFRVQLAPRGVALDLGAAPGGWTRVLRQHEQFVTAVDPGDLDPRLLADRNVRHKRMTAEAYLQDDPDPCDIIVNDMRMDARDSARLMAAYARLLYPHGLALMTLKLPVHDRSKVVDHALSILRQVYEVSGARQLFHNRSEITVLLRPKRHA